MQVGYELREFFQNTLSEQQVERETTTDQGRW